MVQVSTGSSLQTWTKNITVFRLWKMQIKSHENSIGNMRPYLLLILLFISILGCSKNEGNQIIIDEDFENLSIIDKWIEDKEIVFLGEPTHGDGSIFTARIKIIV